MTIHFFKMICFDLIIETSAYMQRNSSKVPITQGSLNFSFAQDNSRIIQIPTLYVPPLLAFYHSLCWRYFLSRRYSD